MLGTVELGMELKLPLLMKTDVGGDDPPRPLATTETSAFMAAEFAETVSTPAGERLQLLVTLQVTVVPPSFAQLAVAVLPPLLKVHEQPPLGQLDATSWKVEPAVKL